MIFPIQKPYQLKETNTKTNRRQSDDDGDCVAAMAVVFLFLLGFAVAVHKSDVSVCAP